MGKMNIQFFISSIILFLVGSLLHFAYEISDGNFIVGVFTPVNESVWEHLKLATFPILLWWLVFYLRKKSTYKIDKNKWFLGCFVSIIASNIIILGTHYFINCGLDINLTIIDIILLYIALLIGQFTGYHVYYYSKIDNIYFSVGAIAIVVLLFVIFTIVPPKLPVFKDPLTRTYGIYQQWE